MLQNCLYRPPDKPVFFSRFFHTLFLYRGKFQLWFYQTHAHNSKQQWGLLTDQLIASKVIKAWRKDILSHFFNIFSEMVLQATSEDQLDGKEKQWLSIRKDAVQWETAFIRRREIFLVATFSEATSWRKTCLWDRFREELSEEGPGPAWGKTSRN